ncbi:MAG: aminoglycoside 6'-N-acetyltransferase [Oligoflexales bacterium]
MTKRNKFDFEIQPADEAAYPDWAYMRAVLWPTATIEDHLSEIRNLVGTDAWIVWHDNKPIGFAEASIRPYANGCQSRPVAFLEGIWVAPLFRQAGVAKGLVTTVEEWAKARGIFELGSDAELSNSLSHTCHKQWGFEETERVVYFRKALK